jgi:hypothetical protein
MVQLKRGLSGPLQNGALSDARNGSGAETAPADRLFDRDNREPVLAAAARRFPPFRHSRRPFDADSTADIGSPCLAFRAVRSSTSLVRRRHLATWR